MRSRSTLLAWFLAATTIAGCANEPLEPSCAVPGGETSRSSVACASDRELLALIAKADGKVFVGFKEAGTNRGVDTLGNNLTSEVTTQAMMQLLRDRGMAISWRSKYIPAVAGVLPLRLELIAEIRRHPNVDYLEPSPPGTFQ